MAAALVLETNVLGRESSSLSSRTKFRPVAGIGRRGALKTRFIVGSSPTGPTKSRKPIGQASGCKPDLLGSTPRRLSMRRRWAIGSPAVSKTAAPSGHRSSNLLSSAMYYNFLLDS